MGLGVARHQGGYKSVVLIQIVIKSLRLLLLGLRRIRRGQELVAGVSVEVMESSLVI